MVEILKIKSLMSTMYRIRKFEEEAYKLVTLGLVPGNIHSSIGQEAVAAGVCGALAGQDYIVSNHRGHGHCIAKGMEITLMVDELKGLPSGSNGGRGGSMHIYDVNNGILGTNGVVGGGIGMATGAAYGLMVEGSKSIVVCFFGDGASSQGILHECMNIASLWKLPIVFLCENNKYAEMTHASIHVAGGKVSRRAVGYEMPGISVEGNNILAVYEAALEAVDRARRGDGPTLLECETYRIRGHFEGDPQRYKNEKEQREWENNDPLINGLKIIEDAIGGVWTEWPDQKNRIDQEISRSFEV